MDICHPLYVWIWSKLFSFVNAPPSQPYRNFSGDGSRTSQMLGKWERRASDQITRREEINFLIDNQLIWNNLFLQCAKRKNHSISQLPQLSLSRAVFHNKHGWSWRNICYLRLKLCFEDFPLSYRENWAKRWWSLSGRVLVASLAPQLSDMCLSANSSSSQFSSVWRVSSPKSHRNLSPFLLIDWVCF